MLVIKPPVFLNDPQRAYQRNKMIKRYDALNPGYQTQHNYDLRLIIFRHAERIDQSLGHDWYDKVFGGVPSAPVQAYRHPELPYRLPPRSNTLLYVFDPPISRTGEQQSFNKGQELLRTGTTIDYCYSSPAARSVLTANAILKGMNRSQVPIRIEPYLFEPMNWNSALLLIPKMNPFMSTSDWKRSGYNIDQRYRRLGNNLNLHETETDYYRRSRHFFDSVVHHHSRMLPAVPHGHAARRRTTVMIVGHASSTEVFSMIGLRKPFDAKTFTGQANKVPYLHTAVLERDAVTRVWYLRPFLQFR